MRQGESRVPADNRGHAETNKRAPEDAGGICAKRHDQGGAPAHRFMGVCGARPARAFLFCFEWFMAFASVRDFMMISGNRRHRDCGNANATGRIEHADG